MIQPENTGVRRAAGSTSAQGASAAQANVATESAGASFRALLERLEKSAKDLDAASEAIDNPRQLGEVVETARASVEEALLAGSDLLEAYRAAQAHGSSDAPTTDTQKPTDSLNTPARTGQGEAQ